MNYKEERMCIDTVAARTYLRGKSAPLRGQGNRRQIYCPRYMAVELVRTNNIQRYLSYPTSVYAPGGVLLSI
jgi:hypothetical protein